MSVYKFQDGKIEPLKEDRGDASPRTEQTEVDAAEEPRTEQTEVDAAEEPDTPKTLLAAAIDKATGFAGGGTKRTGTPAARTIPKEAGAEARHPAKRDWVEEAYKCFIKDAGDIDPTDPVKAIEAYFQKNATDELKARCKAEGKDAKGCWKFIEAVARRALGGRSGHIDPGVVYAIAIHWFEDVPKDWMTGNGGQGTGNGRPEKKPMTRKERLEERVAHGSTKAKAKLRELKKKERAKSGKAARHPEKKAKKPRESQGFFFEMLETPVATPEKESEVQG